MSRPRTLTLIDLIDDPALRELLASLDPGYLPREELLEKLGAALKDADERGKKAEILESALRSMEGWNQAQQATIAALHRKLSALDPISPARDIVFGEVIYHDEPAPTDPGWVWGRVKALESQRQMDLAEREETIRVYQKAICELNETIMAYEKAIHEQNATLIRLSQENVRLKMKAATPRP